MAKFRSRPVEIEAIRMPALNEPVGDFLDWAVKTGLQLPAFSSDGSLPIETPSGLTVTARPGDWIIQGVHGDFYPCHPDFFERNYEAVR